VSIPIIHSAQLTSLDDLKPHPRNYRAHPDDQRRHLVQSIDEHGFYRNVVVATDGTILAGHGVVAAAAEAGLEAIPVVRLELEPDDPRALKLLAADNELPRFAVTDDRALANLLREIGETDVAGLLGTGYDDAMLASLVFTTRPESEIPQRDDAAQWVGMPGYEQGERPPQLIINFEDEAERSRVLELLGIDAVHNRQRRVWAVWWPPRDRDDVLSLRFTEATS
jgi:hypothetical protein